MWDLCGNMWMYVEFTWDMWNSGANYADRKDSTRALRGVVRILRGAIGILRGIYVGIYL